LRHFILILRFLVVYVPKQGRQFFGQCQSLHVNCWPRGGLAIYPLSRRRNIGHNLWGKGMTSVVFLLASRRSERSISAGFPIPSKSRVSSLFWWTDQISKKLWYKTIVFWLLAFVLDVIVKSSKSSWWMSIESTSIKNLVPIQWTITTLNRR
jgi:hypothetical protein